MNKIIFGCFAILMVACQDAHVIKVDGKTLAAYCQAGNWVKCIAEQCPNGYDIVRNADIAIIKCKP